MIVDVAVHVVFSLKYWVLSLKISALIKGNENWNLEKWTNLCLYIFFSLCLICLIIFMIEYWNGLDQVKWHETLILVLTPLVPLTGLVVLVDAFRRLHLSLGFTSRYSISKNQILI